MGKPGGFFKRLHSKQKRKASRQQRGTKGASKEERRRKREEQAIYYAAKREADRLAAVSSSDDDVDVDAMSTDSDEIRERRMKGVKKLRSVLGVKNPGSRRSKKMGKHSAPISDEVVMEDEENKGENSHSFDRKKGGHEKLYPSHHAALFAADDKEEEEAEEEENEDWHHFIGNEESEDDGLLADWGEENKGEEEEDEEDENGLDNPLFSLEGKEDENGNGPENDIFDDVLEFDEAVEEEEEEEEDREEVYIDEDDGDEEEELHSRRKKKNKKFKEKSKEEEDAISSLLPRFRWGTSSNQTLESSGVVNIRDPWYRKFHLNELPPSLEPSSSKAMVRIDLNPVAEEALARSYAPYMQKAELEFNEMLSQKKQRLPSFVRKEDYGKLKPSNVAVDVSPTAAAGLLHAPFDPTTPPGHATLGQSVQNKVRQSSAVENSRYTENNTSTTDGEKQVSSESIESHVDSVKPPYLHQELWNKWQVYRVQRQGLPAFTVEERGILDLLQGYADLLDTTRQWQKTKSRRDIFALHLLNHWFKAKSVVVAHEKMLKEWKRKKHEGLQRGDEKKKKSGKEKKNKGLHKILEDEKNEEEQTVIDYHKTKKEKGSKKKAKKEGNSQKYTEEEMSGISDTHEKNEEEEENDEEEVPDLDDYELRDRGFTKTRLLLVLPLRNHAYHYLSTFVEILGADPNECSKLQLFQADFSEIEEAIDPTFRRRPRDYQREFEGNIDDNFCVGIKLFPSKLDVYAHPLNSDIIIASPLGLRRRIEKNGDALISLSSIEVCVIDEAQMLLQQNWAHVAVLLEELLNQRPTDTTRGLSDLRRIYSWALENEINSHRQTIISSDICSASLLSTFRAMPNSWGKIRLCNKQEEGLLTLVKVAVQQHFMRYTPQSLATSDEERLEYFTKHIFASRLNPLAERDVRIIIYVPSYFDFVRLRSFLYREYRDTFAAISEYSSLKQQRKALGQFSDLERPVLLVTERFYYFKRYFVSMSEVVVFYSPPLIPSFYLSFVNRLVAESPNVFSLCVFCRYDIHELVRIVGTQKAQQLLQRESSVYSFVTN